MGYAVFFLHEGTQSCRVIRSVLGIVIHQSDKPGDTQMGLIQILQAAAQHIVHSIVLKVIVPEHTVFRIAKTQGGIRLEVSSAKAAKIVKQGADTSLIQPIP